MDRRHFLRLALLTHPDKQPLTPEAADELSKIAPELSCLPPNERFAKIMTYLTTTPRIPEFANAVDIVIPLDSVDSDALGADVIVLDTDKKNFVKLCRCGGELLFTNSCPVGRNVSIPNLAAGFMAELRWLQPEVPCSVCLKRDTGSRIMQFVALSFLTALASPPFATELYETCSNEAGFQARCGPGANCLVMGGIPTCHCIIDLSTGLPLAGNPYRGCTWDLTGRWTVDVSDELRSRVLNDPFTNEPFIIQIDRTDAILKTQYMTGAIFVVTAVTSAASGVCARVFVDINDNESVIFEMAEGFADRTGRQLFFRNGVSDVSLTKKHPPKSTVKDMRYLWGGWRKWDGSKVKIWDFKRLATKRLRSDQSAALTPGWAYWYDDDSFGAPAVRVSTALFMDETLPFEMNAFDTTNRFIQVGWFGKLAFGASAISIISPADGKEVFILRRVFDWEAPKLIIPELQPTVFTLTGETQLNQILQAAQNALPQRTLRNDSRRALVGGFIANNNTWVQSVSYSPSDGRLFTGVDRIGVSQRRLSQSPKANDNDYPQPRAHTSLAQCPLRTLYTAPKVTLEDLQTAFQRAPGNDGRMNIAVNSKNIFPENDFFGETMSQEDSGSSYNLFWRRMADRLAQATADRVR